MTSIPRATARRIARPWWVVRTLARAGLVAPQRPDRYLRSLGVVRRQGVTPLTGIALSAVRRPQGTALVDERGSLTWAELDARSDALAVGLAEERGHRNGPVAVLCRNHRGFVEALAASTRLGTDALLLNTGFSGPQLADVLEREGAALLVYDDEFAPLLEEARSRVAPAEIVAWSDEPGDVPTVDQLIERHHGAAPSKPDTPGRTILLTSGTTGTPKGARLSGGGGAGSLAAMFDRIPWRAEETTLVAAPMFHAWGFGQLAVSATLACTVVMRRRFDPEATLELADRSGATGLAVVPVMLERIVDLPEEVLDRYDLGSLRFVTASGSRMRPDAVTRFMDRFGDVVFNSYNATEAGLITCATPEDLRAAPDTAGRPVAGTELRILDDEGREVAPGEVGRIAVRSDSHFDGYTSGDTKDFAAGFMVSGDVGRIDDHGRLFVVGRDDEMIVSGGENVYPLEVEETLNAHDDVREAAVVGVEDDQYGQRLAAFVVLEPGRSATPDDLKAHVKAQLAGYKVPRDLTLVDELPRNASGKVVKRQLVEDQG
ncbi:MAG TPA: AMP-binding protein [Nocardioides sp.]|nr:AMP-binding protein [Nocardioides sp.]